MALMVAFVSVLIVCASSQQGQHLYKRVRLDTLFYIKCWRGTSVISALGTLRQEDGEFKVSLRLHSKVLLQPTNTSLIN